jgi:ssDNA-binding Zn-finger/Zn-ribbon topoisomerase 1
MVICPDCGKPVRYINAARGEGIFMVEAEPETLIGDNGRVLIGYREHKCPEDKKEKTDGK